MAAKIKEFYKDNQLLVIGVVFLIVALVFGWLLRTDRTAGDNVDNTIQQITTDNARAGAEIKSASGQVDEAQRNISGAVERTERVEKLTKESQATVNECEQLTSDCQDLNREAKSILADVELANKKRTSGKTTGTAAK